MPKRIVTAVAAATLILTAGCGSSRPSADDLSKSIQKQSKGQVTKKQADCMGEVMNKSKISDEGLRAIVKQDKKFKASKKDESAMKSATGDIMQCASKK